jgi:hypothetical protein
MEQKELERRVGLYLERAKRDREVINYPVDEVNHWKILSGSMGDHNERSFIGEVLHGKFIDAVAYAVQQFRFYSNLYSNEDPSNVDNGIIIKAEIHELEDYLINLKSGLLR